MANSVLLTLWNKDLEIADEVEFEYVNSSELLDAINEAAGTNHKKIEDLSDGATYLTLLRGLFEECFSFADVIYNPNSRSECMNNWIIIRQLFQTLNYESFSLHAYKIVDRKYMACYSFLKWFLKFFGEVRYYQLLMCFPDSPPAKIMKME